MEYIVHGSMVWLCCNYVFIVLIYILHFFVLEIILFLINCIWITNLIACILLCSWRQISVLNV